MNESEGWMEEWYRAHLSASDILAGGVITILALISIFFCGLIMIVLSKASKEMIGFRYIVSSTVADILCIVQYGILDGLAILTKSQLASGEERSWLQLWMDWVWFVSCFHLPLIAWSRFHAIYFMHSFRKEPQWMSYCICVAFAWILPLVICCATHWQPFYVRFYIEPAMYGIGSEDPLKYVQDGMFSMFHVIHIFVAVLPLVLYILCIIRLIKNRVGQATKTAGGSKMRSVEANLLIPCILGTINFALVQVVFEIGIGSSPWASWTGFVLMLLLSALHPVILVAFSPYLRKAVASLIGFRQENSILTSTVASVAK